MFSGLSRLRLLSVLLTLVLAAPPLGGRLSDRPAAQAAGSQPSAVPFPLNGVGCASPSTCLAVGDFGTILRRTDGGSTWRSQPSGTNRTPAWRGLRAPQHLPGRGRHSGKRKQWQDPAQPGRGPHLAQNPPLTGAQDPAERSRGAPLCAPCGSPGAPGALPAVGLLLRGLAHLIR